MSRMQLRRPKRLDFFGAGPWAADDGPWDAVTALGRRAAAPPARRPSAGERRMRNLACTAFSRYNRKYTDVIPHGTLLVVGGVGGSTGPWMALGREGGLAADPPSPCPDDPGAREKRSKLTFSHALRGAPRATHRRMSVATL
jgi:hypothetical protein